MKGQSKINHYDKNVDVWPLFLTNMSLTLYLSVKKDLTFSDSESILMISIIKEPNQTLKLLKVIKIEIEKYADWSNQKKNKTKHKKK
ncbi:hypothetical protein BpHYR1_054141 [Brachionus plicatilis]|uniref:Uncharacterized protein n=1 Tax=Brachionus plicatilis TaxID=10195 RepID=A0A3M7S974_BRAPC|nr:hypothetical protein BpHYR1_054141 [Brachionus plicatilis]